MHPATAGFTLIEILVVLAVVAMLAALLMPALTAVRDAAHGVRCGGNLRQIGLAFHAYADDEHGRFPPLSVTAHGLPSDGRWYTNLLADGDLLPVGVWRNQVYGNVATGVWRCPSVGSGAIYWGGGYGILERRTGCAHAWHGFGYSGQTIRRQMITRSGSRALVCEAERSLGGGWVTSPGISCPETFPEEWQTANLVLGNRRAAARHGGGKRSNLVFMDGHVAGLPWLDARDGQDDLWGHGTP